MTARFGIPLAALLMSGCTMAPRYERPVTPVPAQWPTGEAYPAPTESAPPILDRATIFRDPRVQRLMEQALVNNRDLRVAAANIVRALALFG